jgi:hypothetical protein
VQKDTTREGGGGDLVLQIKKQDKTKTDYQDKTIPTHQSKKEDGTREVCFKKTRRRKKKKRVHKAQKEFGWFIGWFKTIWSNGRTQDQVLYSHYFH